jgi:hypothetical protein
MLVKDTTRASTALWPATPSLIDRCGLITTIQLRLGHVT